MYGVLVFDHTAVLRHRFAIKVGDSGFQWSTSSPSLTVNDNNKVLVLGKRRILAGYCQSVVDVFETDGQFVRTFGEGILMNASDITAGNEGRVMVVDGEDHVFVHVFSEQGEHLLKEKLSKFEVGGTLDHKIAFHPASEHVIVARIETRKRPLCLLILTNNGKFVRSTELTFEHDEDEDEDDGLQGISVTSEGRIVVCLGPMDSDNNSPAKVLVV